MGADGVRAKTSTEAAEAIRQACEDMWKEFEAVAGQRIAADIKARGGGEDRQAQAASAAARIASMRREDLAWDVFGMPGTGWRAKHWELAPIHPDGRRSSDELEQGIKRGELVVSATDTVEDIAARLDALRTNHTERV